MVWCGRLRPAEMLVGKGRWVVAAIDVRCFHCLTLVRVLHGLLYGEGTDGGTAGVCLAYNVDRVVWIGDRWLLLFFCPCCFRRCSSQALKKLFRFVVCLFSCCFLFCRFFLHFFHLFDLVHTSGGLMMLSLPVLADRSTSKRFAHTTGVKREDKCQ